VITEATIRSALRSAPNSGMSIIELKDDGERGAGRLALRIRVAKTRVTAEWYAVWYRAGKREMTKIGSYPTMSLVEARKEFRVNFAPTISTGEAPTGPRARVHARGTTIKDLFEAYYESLKAAEKPSAKNVQWILLTGRYAAAKAIGETLPAAKIRPSHITPYLAETHERGAVVMAREARAYISAAFAFAMKSEHDYRKSGGIAWGVESNPAAAIPVDENSFRVGDRHLSPAEFRALWNWLGDHDVSRAATALRLIMVTGQRVQEITRLRDTQYDRREKMLEWSKTKNGRPHAIPLPSQALTLLNCVTPNRRGVFFPHRDKPDQSLTTEAVKRLIGRFLEEFDAEAFTTRDLRRTWKTLAGAAGLSKEIRDRIQNHARSDVSSRHYDRYEYLPEKRAAMKTWSEYLDRIISGELDNPVVELRAKSGKGQRAALSSSTDRRSRSAVAARRRA
jgi:integrase